MSSGSVEPENALSARLHGDRDVCQYHQHEKCDPSASVCKSDDKGRFQHDVSTRVSRSDNRWQYHHAENSVISSRSQFSQSVISDITGPCFNQLENVGVRSSQFSSRVDNYSNPRLCQSDSNIPDHPEDGNIPQTTLFSSVLGSRSNVTGEIPTPSHRPYVRPTSLDVRPSSPQQPTILRSAPVISSNFEPFHNISAPTIDGRYSFPVTLPHGAYQQLRTVDSRASGGSRAFTSESSVQSPMLYGDSYEVNVNCSVQRGPPRVRSALQVQPVPHYWAGAAPVPPHQPRSFTSVNLTLRPPSAEPQPPIDIQTGPSSLTYSTSSYDARGFRSDLQIRIGPGGTGSVSAMRMLAHPSWPPRTPTQSQPLAMLTESSEVSTTSPEESLQDLVRMLNAEHLQPCTKVLLEQQMERKSRLQCELHREKEKLRAMQRDVRTMEKDLAQRQLLKNCPVALPALNTLQKVQRLRQEIHLLQEECKRMTQEVDIKSDATVPLGETDEEFYKNIYTGQHGFVAVETAEMLPSPHRPEPVRETGEGPHWTCTECTFRNHPLLDKCEQCEMPRIMLGSEPCYCHPRKLNPPNPLTLPLMIPPCQQT